MRVLVYAPVDLNLIDGSAIWCASVAQMLCHDGDVHVDILRHTPPQRELTTAALTRHPRITLHDPWARRKDRAWRSLRDRLGPRLTGEQAFARLAALHADQPYDLVIVRGGDICQRVAQAPSLAARCWFYLTQHGADRATLSALSQTNGRIACQTPLLQEYLEDLLGPDPDRYVPLPPMVPELLCPQPRTARTGRKLCYVGKFESDYMIVEMLTAFRTLRERFPDAECIVAGDKYHDPERTGALEREVRPILTGGAGVTWHGALSREAVGPLMTQCDVGSCWRSAHYDASLELSTKALEYAAAGLPVLLNATRINRLIFGADYPLFVDTPDSFVARLAAALSDDTLYAAAAQRAHEVCRSYTFAEVNARLQPVLAGYRSGPGASGADSAASKPAPDLTATATPATVATAAAATVTAPARPRRPRRILFVGHDLKFCREIMAHFAQHPGCIVRTDTWRGHTQHDEAASAELLRWADTIWCEWCLGNAVWYSARVRPDQRLVIRLHRQEVTTAYPDEVCWENVAQLIFIAPHVRDEIRKRIGAGRFDRTQLIYNTFDCERFDLDKPADSAYRLGLIGYCPKLKHPLLALDILRHLRGADPRWRLALVGKPPQSYAWLWNRPEEREYYERFEAEAQRDGLADAIERQDWTDEPAAWYAGVGYILSCSDLEGSHQAIAEGMAAGCVPVVRRWRGAAEMYPHSLLFTNAGEAARHIRAASEPAQRDARAQAAREEARARFDVRVILPQLEALLLAPAVAASPRPVASAL